VNRWGALSGKIDRCIFVVWEWGQLGAVAMSNDEPRGANDRVDQLNQFEEEKKSRQREALERFGQYAAPAMMAVLLSERVYGGTYTSDIRVKRDITRLGRLPNDINLYRYRYVWSDAFFVGVMAHEVASVNPDAVRRGADGYDRVDYARLGLRLQTWDEWTAAA
jgi:hypothetical protein